MTKERLRELSAAAKYRSTAVLLVKSLMSRGGDLVKAAAIRVPPVKIEPHELEELIALALEHTGDEK